MRVSELQRGRLLSAAVVTIAELGYASTSVAHVCARARVSRRTFYELFEDRQDCLLAVLEDAVERVVGEIDAAGLAESPWRERVRSGLFVILSFFDREPVLARVCVVQALQGGPRVLEWREGVLARLAHVLDEGRGESSRSQQCTALTAEGLVGAAFSIVYARLLVKDRRESLTGLLGKLMSLIVLPYLGAAAARSEQRRVLPSGVEHVAHEGAPSMMFEPNPLRDLPMRLTYRTAMVLNGVAAHPSASNRSVADYAGITDQGQVSKLLARLQRLGLLRNTGEGPSKGEPNAWSLTPTGQRVTDSLTAHGVSR
jgi:AcrR family transcriptional regulator